ncbi:acyl-CoA thioesterase [Bacillaceae bacterium SIJ1]|uniref:acyl-CoA thioesterase n=1 Tax=Litoribacterium kuwaitense TaxID=1398745 RepID=UPI0013EC7B28|nr:thioesterase family protein [Litoribacterium kuwaitense]NGP44029.1 acyl-CoA thioesterase [Litoribacterium kuwaitense]
MITTTEVKVRYGETDQMGVVYHANYVVYLELGRTDFINNLGFEYHDMESEGYVSPVLSIQLNYKKALTYGETASIATWLEAYDGLRTTYGYRISNAKDETCAEGHSVHLCVKKDSFRPVPLRKAFPEWDQAYKNVLKEI